MVARVAAGQMAEAHVLRRTRLKLVAWSAGSTLVVLVAMGGVLYAATAQFLAADSVAMLRQRAATFLISDIAYTSGTVSTVDHAPPPVVTLDPAPGTGVGTDRALIPVPVSFSVVSDPGSAGMVVGGPASGTIAIAVPEGSVNTTTMTGIGTLDSAGYQEALGGGLTVINETPVLGAPMRVLSQPVTDAPQPFVIQVAADRTAELRTLEGLALILGVAGAAAVAVAAAFGWLYAGRALVPVRESLRRQREFAADASHELRTPLAVIRGNLELLRGRRGDGATDIVPATADPDPLDEIDAEVDRLSGLVDQLLLLARADSDALEMERRPSDLGAEAADALDALMPVAAIRHVVLALDVASVPLQADPARLRQLVTILIDNAIRHAPRGGRVEVTVAAHDGQATLQVTDDGPGIRPQDLPHVFDRFWRAADAPAGGSGLGLAIAAWITHEHDGTIAAANVPGGGARFEVRLPIG